MTKQQDFGTFTKSYKPLRFKFGGVILREHMPHKTLFDEPHLIWIRLKSLVGLRITYFDLRASMTPVGKKRADMAFLTHVIQKCTRDAENTPRMRFYMTRLRYFPELWYIDRHIDTKQADNYMLRWGYLLDHDPGFDELIHGTTGAAAWYALENLE